MSKKIKYFSIVIIAILALFTLTQATLAWSPANQTPIYPQGDDYDTYFCKQKGGPIRFKQFDPGYFEKTLSLIVTAGR